VRFVAAMASRGETFLQDIVQHLPAAVTRGGIEYFRHLIEAFNRSRAERGNRARQKIAKSGAFSLRQRTR
jgi:hypothetical protein